MVLEQKIRDVMRRDGWELFMQSFGLRVDEDLQSLSRNGAMLDSSTKELLMANERRFMSLISVLGSSRMCLPFSSVSADVVNEHKLWLLMEFLADRPDCVPLVESRL